MLTSRAEIGPVEPAHLGPGRLVARSWMAGSRRVAPFAVSAACLALLLWVLGGRLPAVWQVVRGTDPALLAVAMLAYPLAWYALAVRISRVFRAFGFGQPAHCFFLYTMVGHFFSLFLPTSVGGDLVKAGYAAGRTDRIADAVVATFLDRGVGLISTILVAGVGLAFFPFLGVGELVLWLPALVAIGLIGLVLAGRREAWVAWLPDRLERVALAARLRLPRIARAVLGLFRTPRLLLATLLLGLLAHACSTLSLWLSARALGIEAAYPSLLLVVPVVTLAALLPSIRLVGIREAALVVVLQALMPEAEALALTIVFSGVGLLWAAAGGLVFLLRKPLGLRLPERSRRGSPA